VTLEYPSEGLAGGDGNVDLTAQVAHGVIAGEHAPDCALNSPLPEVAPGLVGGPMLTHPGCTCGATTETADAAR
jgi:hypothetical protein